MRNSRFPTKFIQPRRNSTSIGFKRGKPASFRGCKLNSKTGIFRGRARTTSFPLDEKYIRVSAPAIARFARAGKWNKVVESSCRSDVKGGAVAREKSPLRESLFISPPDVIFRRIVFRTITYIFVRIEGLK